MKKLNIFMFVVAAVLAALPLRAYENFAGPLSSWTTAVTTPAWGTVTPGTVAFRSDSIVAANVRYTASSAAPAAMLTRTLLTPQPKKYSFGAWVNITRPDACLTLSVHDAAGKRIGSVSVSTAASTPGALTPGRWTPVTLTADLAALDSEARSAVTFAVEPMWNGNAAVVTDVAPTILLSDLTITAGETSGLYGGADVSNGEFERWSATTTGTGRSPIDWTGASVERVAGVHANDHALRVPANTNVTATAVPATATSGSRLRLMARADRSTTISLHEGAAVRAQATLAPGVWREVVIPVAVSGQITLSADNIWSLDGVRIEEVYDMNTPRPTERTLHVTTSADDGPGSLRAVVREACTGDLIVFDVNTVNVATTIDLSDKYVTIDGSTDSEADRLVEIVRTDTDAPVFTVSPNVDGTVLRLRNLLIKGATEPVTNGGGLYVGDTRSTGTARIVLDRITFDGTCAKNVGGAVYLAAPNVETIINQCVFRNCSAATGAAIAFTRGTSVGVFASDFDNCSSTGTAGGAIATTVNADAPVTISRCDFTRCTSTASTGGAGAITITSAATPARINRCQFDYCAGGRGLAINIYNTSRTSSMAETTITNCTAVNNTGASPVVYVGMTSRYPAPTVVMVNNLIVNNESQGLVVGGGTVTGSHNAIENTTATLDNPVDISVGKVFLEYDAQGDPKRCDVQRSPYGVDKTGPAYDKGVDKYLLASGEDVVSSDSFEGPIEGYPATTTSVGASEYHGPEGGIEDAQTDFGGVSVWPNPATTTLNIDGVYNRMWLTDISGTTVLTATGDTVDVSGLPRGMYVASFECDGQLYTTKIIIR